MRHTRHSYREPGQSVLEVVIALAFLALILNTLVIFLNSQLGQLSKMRDSLRAVTLAEEGLEASRAIRDRDWASVAPGTYGLALVNQQWVFQGSSDISDGLERNITIVDVATNERAVVATVAAHATSSRLQPVMLGTLLTNWKNSIPPRLSGNWANPQTLGSIDLGPGNSATGVAVQSKIVYLTATASDSKKNDFYVVNATNGQSPFVAGSVNTGSGLNGVAVTGTYAYVANQSNKPQLQVIDISHSNAPVVASSLTLPTDQEGLSVSLNGTLLYVGTEKGSGPEFYVVDVSDPLNPVKKGSLEIDADVNRVFAFRNRVFLATSKDDGEFHVVDATSSTHPVLVKKIDLPGSKDARELYINDQDNRAYVTRAQGDNSGQPEVSIFDVTNTDAPSLLGSYSFATDVNGVFAADTLAFFGTADSNAEFKIYNVTNAASIQPYSSLNFSQVASDIAFENNIIYVAVRSNDALRILTSQ